MPVVNSGVAPSFQRAGEFGLLGKREIFKASFDILEFKNSNGLNRMLA